MTQSEFEKFVLDNGQDVLRFCRVSTASKELGDDLYQETMLKVFEKRKKLDVSQNVKSYAISVAILLWKNHKKKYAVRNRIAGEISYEMARDAGEQFAEGSVADVEEHIVLQEEVALLKHAISELPDKYKMPLYLSYSANMTMEEIASCLKIPVGTVKTRIHNAKELLRERMEDF